MKYKEQVYEAIKSPDVWEYIWREVKTFDDMEQIYR
jgi:N-acetyltransferase